MSVSRDGGTGKDIMPRLAVALFAILALIAASCGGDDDDPAGESADDAVEDDVGADDGDTGDDAEDAVSDADDSDASTDDLEDDADEGDAGDDSDAEPINLRGLATPAPDQPCLYHPKLFFVDIDFAGEIDEVR